VTELESLDLALSPAVGKRPVFTDVSLARVHMAL